MLLNPFDDDPFDHLVFNLNGTIEFLTARGKATIETVGLWRNSLVTQRRQRLRGLHLNIKDLLKAVNQNPPNTIAIRITVRNILDQGNEIEGVFPGVARAYFRRVTGLSWSDLEQMSGQSDKDA